MKLRNDFVSNSSSSSFIVHDTINLFSTFGITCQDIYETIMELMGETNYPEYSGDKVIYDLYDGPPCVVYDIKRILLNSDPVAVV